MWSTNSGSASSRLTTCAVTSVAPAGYSTSVMISTACSSAAARMISRPASANPPSSWMIAARGGPPLTATAMSISALSRSGVIGDTLKTKSVSSTRAGVAGPGMSIGTSSRVAMSFMGVASVVDCGPITAMTPSLEIARCSSDAAVSGSLAES